MKTKRVAYAMVAGIMAASGYLATLTSSPAAAAPPSITVAKTANPTSRPAPGGDFTFSLVVRNTDVDPATVTSLVDNIYGNLSGKGTCAIGNVLAAGATYTCSFTGNFTAPAGASQTDTVTATVRNAVGTTATASSSATVTITTPTTDLAISATGPSSASSAPGSQFPVSVHVVNQGSDPSTQGTIVVTGTLPAGVILASGTGGGFGCTTNGQTLTCTRTASLAPGGTADLALVLTVTDPNLTAALLTFRVNDPGANDPNGANNSASVSVPLNRSTAPNSFFDPNGIVQQCLATCSVENNHQDSTIKVTDPGAPQSERDRDRAERDADRAADRGGAPADPASGALAASGTKAQPTSASGASPASSSRIPFTGAPVQRFALSALALLILGSMLINNARSGKALEATASGRARWRHRRRR